MAGKNTELADFLRRARSQGDASRAGLPADGRVRRVPGLRREEVAFLAGVSTDYYARLEQGRRIVPSPSAVDAIGRALGLDQAGRAHLADLIGLGSASVQPRTRPVQRVRPGLYQLLDALGDAPVLVLGRRADVLAQNRMGRALFTDFERLPAPRRNYARWMFLDDGARSLFVDWEEQARAAVENLRLEAGNDPADRATSALIAELREASPSLATGGPSTASISARTGPSGCGTPSSATSPSSTRPSPCPATPARRCTSTRPSRARRPSAR